MPALKFPPNPEVDALITDAYRRLREHKNTKAIGALIGKTGWPKWAILKRAQALGLAKTKERPWSDAEEQLLDKYGGLALGSIHRRFRLAGFTRSRTAIAVKAKRNKIRETPAFYSLHALSLALGIPASTVRGFARAGLIHAVPSGTNRTANQGGDAFVVSRSEIRKFLLNHPELIHLPNIVDKYWFIDILSGGKICEAFKREAA